MHHLKTDLILFHRNSSLISFWFLAVMQCITVCSFCIIIIVLDCVVLAGICKCAFYCPTVSRPYWYCTLTHVCV